MWPNTQNILCGVKSNRNYRLSASRVFLTRVNAFGFSGRERCADVEERVLDKLTAFINRIKDFGRVPSDTKSDNFVRDRVFKRE